ncbi:MAG: hypothetical protein WAV28_16555 [Sedimentisphaerales bacterium]
MNFKISNVEHYISPHELKVDEILNTYSTSLDDMKKTMMAAIFARRNNIPVTKDLAKQLKDLSERLFTNGGVKLYQYGYSPTMRENPDVAIGRTGRPKKIFIEIEFRPNEHKDIVKFLIGYKKQTLELGILIVSINRDAINKGYYTMLEYKKCVQTIEELQSDCPILVLGVDGRLIPA